MICFTNDGHDLAGERVIRISDSNFESQMPSIMDSS